MEGWGETKYSVDQLLRMNILSWFQDLFTHFKSIFDMVKGSHHRLCQTLHGGRGGSWQIGPRVIFCGILGPSRLGLGKLSLGRLGLGICFGGKLGPGKLGVG